MYSRRTSQDSFEVTLKKLGKHLKNTFLRITTFNVVQGFICPGDPGSCFVGGNRPPQNLYGHCWHRWLVLLTRNVTCLVGKELELELVQKVKQYQLIIAGFTSIHRTGSDTPRVYPLTELAAMDKAGGVWLGGMTGLTWTRAVLC